jgi:hypothetical protein
MQVKDLDGNIYYWKLIGGISNGYDEQKSSYHLLARQLIKECFPTLQILEEIPIHIRKTEILFLDFYLPLNRKCIEVHGEQHYAFSRFYHKDKIGFLKHKKRDKDKQEWCDVNNIEYVELPYNESLLEWKKRILNEY